MADGVPFVSIVVPTYRRPAQLAACLGALARLDYPRDRFEVVVVDDGSGAPPTEVVTTAAREIQVSLIAASHQGPAAARNAGAARAKGVLLAFTDDDCAPAPGWLQAFRRRFATDPDSMLGGHTVNALPGNVYSSASQALVDYIYGHYNRDPDDARFFASNNLAVPASRFLEVGGFDTSFPLPAAEDRELCLRWRSLGHRLAYVPDAVVHHAHPLRLRTFWRQHFNYGRGAFHLHTMLARQRHDRIRVEPPAFYFRLLTYPLARRRESSTGSRVVVSALLALSQAANAAGFFRERTRDGAS
jgi:GT2 family glycosyltransferase